MGVRSISPGGGGVIGAYLHWLAAGRISEQTLRLREAQLGRFARSFDLLRCDSDDIVAYMARQDWKPNTAASFRTTMGSFYKWALTHNLRDDDPMLHVRSVRVPPNVPKIASAEALAEALAKANRRDRLAVMLAAYAGLRRAEIAKMHARDIDDTWIKVVGKGGRGRKVPIHPDLRPELMRARDMGGYLFPDRWGDGPVTADAMGRRIARLLPEGLTAHSLRHLFATRVYRNSHDLQAVQALLGHSSLATTQVYLHSDDDQLQSAVFGIGA